MFGDADNEDGKDEPPDVVSQLLSEMDLSLLDQRWTACCAKLSDGGRSSRRCRPEMR